VLWYISVWTRDGLIDAAGEMLRRDIQDMGITSVVSVNMVRRYFVEGEVSAEQVEFLCRELFCDRIAEHYAFDDHGGVSIDGARVVEVAFNPGVMDAVAESAMGAIADLGVGGVRSVRTGWRYVLRGDISDHDEAIITERLLLNPVIQHRVGGEESLELPAPRYTLRVVYVDLLGADDQELLELSKKQQLSLNLQEMHAIRDYFSALGRNPTDVELETFAQTWSEHCVHKTFRGTIEYEGTHIVGLLRSTIMRATAELNRRWCVSVFSDNAGVIRFDGDYDLCFKVETHNHPSAIEPYGGAATGIGGVIRDPLGTGLGARPVCNTDVFCFGLPDTPYHKLPAGVLHPRRIAKGVVAGVRDYGNRMGIPTVNGAVIFHEGYVANPVVYCGTVGILPKGKATKEVRPQDAIVLVGGRTGRDGIHGVTMASDELYSDSASVSSGAVQIGNPIMEKKMVDVLLEARERGLYRSVTDCGGGGLSSAVGEMGKNTGVQVDLDKVPLKYEGLSPTEIWISEAQERMILAVPGENVQELIHLFGQEDVEATVIGHFTGDKRLVLRYQKAIVGELDMTFLHEGLPLPQRTALWMEREHREPSFPDPKDLTPDLLAILTAPTVASKEWIVRQYDHEVQGGSVLKPLVGARNDGPGDAAVVRPRLDSQAGFAVANGINPLYGGVDPYWMAASAIDEALRNVVAVGAGLGQTAILDNFCWGNPERPESMGGLVRSCQACYDMAVEFGTPFISGKDSLYNEYQDDGRTCSIPPTLLISALAVMKDVTKAVTMDAKKPGDLIYLLGWTHPELGGSHYYHIRGYVGNRVPQVNPGRARRWMAALHRAIEKGLVRACHDCSEGGIGVAAAEMAFAGDLGMEVRLDAICTRERIGRNDTLLFSESNSRFVVEVAPENRRRFENALRGVPKACVGVLTEDRTFVVYGLGGQRVVSADIGDLKEAWQRTLRW
jgi:phosphoribosylformylglycinamidine synthase II